MSWQIGTVTLPKSPRRVVHPMPAKTSSFPITGDTAYSIGLGIDIEKMVWTVMLHKKGLSLNALGGSYITPLKGYLGSTVVVSTPLDIHNGTWVMSLLQPSVRNDKPDVVNCTIKFERGENIVIV